MQASWYFVDLNCFWELTSSVCDMTIWNHPDTKRAQCLISHHDKNLNFFYTGSTELHVLNIFYMTPLNRFYYHGYCCSGERCGPLASCFNYSGSYIRQISGKLFKLVHHASQISISQKILTHTLEGEGMVHLKKNQLVLCLWWLK